jgi:hypothetical protein
MRPPKKGEPSSQGESAAEWFGSAAELYVEVAATLIKVAADRLIFFARWPWRRASQ